MYESPFADIPPNPKRKLYSLTVFAPYPKNKYDPMCKADRLITEFAEYTCFLNIPQILFPFDGSIGWLTTKLHELGISVVITEIHPLNFISNMPHMWLYVYSYHKANGFAYPAVVDETAHELIEKLNKHHL